MNESPCQRCGVYFYDHDLNSEGECENCEEYLDEQAQKAWARKQRLEGQLEAAQQQQRSSLMSRIVVTRSNYGQTYFRCPECDFAQSTREGMKQHIEHRHIQRSMRDDELRRSNEAFWGKPEEPSEEDMAYVYRSLGITNPNVGIPDPPTENFVSEEGTP
jgi:uncharacterized C2H2 Zn-finger protein